VNISLRLYSEDITSMAAVDFERVDSLGMLFAWTLDAWPLDWAVERTEIDAPIVPHVLDWTQLH
jgi:hypothetical protein